MYVQRFKNVISTALACHVCIIFWKTGSLAYNFSVVKNLLKCNPADFKFYLGEVINKMWENVNFGPVFFAVCIVYCSENSVRLKSNITQYGEILISQLPG